MKETDKLIEFLYLAAINLLILFIILILVHHKFNLNGFEENREIMFTISAQSRNTYTQLLLKMEDY